MKHVAHPFARTIEQEKNCVFKPAFLPTFAVTGGGIAFLITAMGLILWATNPVVPLSAWTAQLLPLFLVGFIGEIPLTIWMNHRMRVEVNPDAVHATTHGNARHSLTWAEIENVEQHRTFGISSWKVSSFRKDSRPIYLPFSVVSNEAFRQRVIETASAVNPLRRALESGNGQPMSQKANA